jgi:hypothetical protein
MASLDASSPRTVSMPRICALERQYYGALLSMAVIDLLLSSIFLALSGKLWIIVFRLPEVFVFLVALMLAGGYQLFRPIRHFLATGEGREAAIMRASRLGAMTTVWLVIVACLFTISSFLVTPFLVFDIPLTQDVVFILVGRALAWVVLLPYVSIFMVHEYLRTLRRRLFEDFGITTPSGTALLGRKLALVFVGGALVPAASIAITLLLVPDHGTAAFRRDYYDDPGRRDCVVARVLGHSALHDSRVSLAVGWYASDRAGRGRWPCRDRDG